MNDVWQEKPTVAPREEEAGAGDGTNPHLWSGADVAWISGLSIGVFILVFAVSLGLYALVSGQDLAALVGRDGRTPADPLLLSLLGLLSSGVGLIVGVGVGAALRNRWQRFRRELKPPSIGWTLGALAASFLAIPLSGLVTLLVQSVLGREIENVQLDFILPAGFSSLGMAGMLFLAGLLVPIGEEMLFRGVLYRWLRERWGVGTGILISGLVFGLFHVEVSVAAGAFALGILLAWFYERSGSLWTAILIHATNNSVKVALIYLFAYLGLPLQ